MPSPKNKNKKSTYSKDRKYLEEFAAKQANVPQENLSNDRRSWQRKVTDNLAGFIENNPTSPSVVYPAIAGFAASPIRMIAGLLGGEVANDVSKKVSGKSIGEHIGEALDINPTIAEFLNPGYAVAGISPKRAIGNVKGFVNTLRNAVRSEVNRTNKQILPIPYIDTPQGKVYTAVNAKQLPKAKKAKGYELKVTDKPTTQEQVQNVPINEENVANIAARNAFNINTSNQASELEPINPNGTYEENYETNVRNFLNLTPAARTAFIENAVTHPGLRGNRLHLLNELDNRGILQQIVGEEELNVIRNSLNDYSSGVDSPLSNNSLRFLNLSMDNRNYLDNDYFDNNRINPNLHINNLVNRNIISRELGDAYLRGLRFQGQSNAPITKPTSFVELGRNLPQNNVNDNTNQNTLRRLATYTRENNTNNTNQSIANSIGSDFEEALEEAGRLNENINNRTPSLINVEPRKTYTSPWDTDIDFTVPNLRARNTKAYSFRDRMRLRTKLYDVLDKAIEDYIDSDLQNEDALNKAKQLYNTYIQMGYWADSTTPVKKQLLLLDQKLEKLKRKNNESVPYSYPSTDDDTGEFIMRYVLGPNSVRGNVTPDGIDITNATFISNNSSAANPNKLLNYVVNNLQKGDKISIASERHLSSNSLPLLLVNAAKHISNPNNEGFKVVPQEGRAEFNSYGQSHRKGFIYQKYNSEKEKKEQADNVRRYFDLFKSAYKKRYGEDLDWMSSDDKGYTPFTLIKLRLGGSLRNQKPLGGSLITNFKNKTKTRLNQIRAAQQTAKDLQAQTLANPITYIGGGEHESRRKFWNSEPVLNHAVDSISKRYNINPRLLKTRLNNEGFVDNIIKNRNLNFVSNVGKYLPLEAAQQRGYDLLNAEIGKERDDIGFQLFGSDYVGNMIDKDKVNTINEQYVKYIPAINEKGEYLDNTVSGLRVKDNFGVMAATLQYLRNQAKRDFPNASSADLDRYANAYYNKGIGGGRQWVRQGASGYNLDKYKNGGHYSLDEARPQAKTGIYIKPENRGKFNATKKRTCKTTEELTHSKNPLTRKRAIFAQNARKWHH